MFRALQFAAVGLVLHLLLWAGFARVIAEHDARAMDARWLAGDRPAELLVGGDSHPRFAVEAPLLGRVANVAVPGEHYLKSMFRIPWLLDHGTRHVPAVALPYDCSSFTGFKSDSYEPEAIWGRYVDWARVGRQRRSPLVYFGKWAKSRFAPYIGEADIVFQYLQGSRHFRDPEAAPGLLPPDVEDGAEAATKHFGHGALAWDPDQEWALRWLVADLHARGLKVILVRYPLSPLYTATAQSFGGDDGRRRDALTKDLRGTGPVADLDFEHVFDARPDLFGDGDHLNVDGKRAFSRLFAKRLEALEVLEAPRWDILERPVGR